jgi:hypothetical protein
VAHALNVRIRSLESAPEACDVDSENQESKDVPDQFWLR